MSWTQRFLLGLMPRTWAKAAEAESRQWRLRCEACSASASVWELGGVRWKASGNPRVRRRCAACGQTGWQALSKDG